MASVASRERPDGQLQQARLSIASSEPFTRAAFAGMERDGLTVEGRPLGSGPAAGERLIASTDVVLIMEDGSQRASVVQTARRRAPDAGTVVVTPAATRAEAR
jgi:hypothetical protein